MGRLDEEHIVIPLKDAAGEVRRLSVLYERQGENRFCPEYNVANVTFVQGALAASLGEMDSGALRALSTSLAAYAARLDGSETDVV